MLQGDGLRERLAHHLNYPWDDNISSLSLRATLSRNVTFAVAERSRGRHVTLRHALLPSGTTQEPTKGSFRSNGAGGGGERYGWSWKTQGLVQQWQRPSVEGTYPKERMKRKKEGQKIKIHESDASYSGALTSAPKTVFSSLNSASPSAIRENSAIVGEGDLLS